MDDRATFDGLWNYAKMYLNGNGLMHWRIDKNGDVIGQNAAADADEDIALALVFADAKWGGYSSDATDCINNMYRAEVESGVYVLKPGDAWGGSNCTNISYYMPAAYRIFADFAGQSGWNRVVDKCYEVINNAKNFHTGLVPDWCKADGSPTPDVTWYPHKNHYYNDAVRFPWRTSIDYLWNGDSRAYSSCNTLTRFFSGVGAQNIKKGYYLDGTPFGTYHASCFVATAGAGAMSSDDLTFARAAYTEVKRIKCREYYQDSLRLFALLLMTGNFPNLYSLP